MLLLRGLLFIFFYIASQLYTAPAQKAQDELYVSDLVQLLPHNVFFIVAESKRTGFFGSTSNSWRSIARTIPNEESPFAGPPAVVFVHGWITPPFSAIENAVVLNRSIQAANDRSSEGQARLPVSLYIFNWDSVTLFHNAQDRASNAARSLASFIGSLGRSHPRIILVGHSLGSLVVLHALGELESSSSRSDAILATALVQAAVPAASLMTFKISPFNAESQEHNMSDKQFTCSGEFSKAIRASKKLIYTVSDFDSALMDLLPLSEKFFRRSIDRCAIDSISAFSIPTALGLRFNPRRVAGYYRSDLPGMTATKGIISTEDTTPPWSFSDFVPLYTMEGFIEHSQVKSVNIDAILSAEENALPFHSDIHSSIFGPLSLKITMQIWEEAMKDEQ